MFSVISARLVKNFRYQIVRRFSSEGPKQGNLKVALCGAAGRSGQAVALMLKSCPLIDELALYDIVGTNGIAMELSHIDTKCKVFSYKGRIGEALKNAQIVAIVVSAGRITSTDMTASFKPNATAVFDIITSCAQHCPKALIVIGSNPVNSLVPMASEVMKSHRVYNKNNIFGVTLLDVIRTNTFVAECQGLPPENVHVPVIGGHSKGTIVPVLSQTRPASQFTSEELLRITNWVQNASDAVIKEQRNASSPLSGALAVATFVTSLVRALKGESGIVQCAYVRSEVYPSLKYLATPIQLGIGGIQKNLGIPKLSEYESCLLNSAANCIAEEITLGEEFVGVKYKPKDFCARIKQCKQ